MYGIGSPHRVSPIRGDIAGFGKIVGDPTHRTASWPTDTHICQTRCDCGYSAMDLPVSNSLSGAFVRMGRKDRCRTAACRRLGRSPTLRLLLSRSSARPTVILFQRPYILRGRAHLEITQYQQLFTMQPRKHKTAIRLRSASR